MDPIRMLLAEDHALVRAGIRSLLQNLPGIRVVAEAGDGREALHLIKADPPNVVLMDITMPRLNGLEATARVTKEFPDVRVIVLSMHKSEEFVLQALLAGAAGYLLKDAGISEVELAIRSVVRGETYLSPAVSGFVVASYIQRLGVDTGETPMALLTPRQREGLQLIAEGSTNKEISKILQISEKTVDTHRTELMNRLNIHDTVGLVRFAIRVGLTTPDV